MSESHDTSIPTGSPASASHGPGKAEAARHEAADLKDTAATRAKDVLDTAKDEASSVVGEATSRAKDLYAQTRHELQDQANTQQQRIADGLRSVGDDLGSMARNADNSGVASDLVQQASARLSRAGAWLGDRDPGSVLTEVKRFARRRPGTFILAAAVTGIVVGRLTRALAANASDADDGAQPTRSPSPAPAPAPTPAPRRVERDPLDPVAASSTGGADVGSPIYAQTASARPEALQEDGDDRPHTV